MIVVVIDEDIEDHPPEKLLTVMHGLSGNPTAFAAQPKCQSGITGVLSTGSQDDSGRQTVNTMTALPIKSFHGNQYTLASESGLVQNEPDRTKHGSRSKVAAEHGTSESYVYRAEQFAKGVEAAEEAVPGVQEEILSGKIRATDREISSIAKVPKEKRPEVVAELRKPKAERDSSITDSYSPPSKDNAFITTFKQDIQGHKKGLNKEEKQNLKDAVKSIYSPRRLADGEAMMCEIQGAQEDFVRRWEMCFREYPDILTEPKNNEKLLIFIDRASQYLQNVKKRLYSDGNQQS